MRERLRPSFFEMPMMPPTFRPRFQQSRREQNAEYDQRRGSARERGYSARWDSAANGFKRHNPLCLGCQAVNRVSATEVVDHVVPHRGDMLIFWDRSKWQPACGWHHTVVKQRLERLFTAGKIGEADLWLNSEVAIRLSNDLSAEGGGWVNSSSQTRSGPAV